MIKICCMIMLFFSKTMLPAAAKHNPTLARAKTTYLSLLQTKLPPDLIDDVNQLAKAPREMVSIRVHYEPLYNLVESRWFNIEVNADATVDLLHDLLASRLNKRKESFALIKRGVVENSLITTPSIKTLENAGIDSYTHILAQEAPLP